MSLFLNRSFAMAAIAAVSLGVVAFHPTAAHAQGASFVTALTGASPTFNRPLTGTPPTSLSGVGTNVYYAVQQFRVSVTGTYNLLSTSTADNFLVIYQNSFNPASSLTNAIYASDDFSGSNAGSSGLSLTAGVNYYYVATTFDNLTTTTITNSIGTVTRPAGASVTIVPESNSVALLGAGVLPLVGGVVLRRRKK